MTSGLPATSPDEQMGSPQALMVMVPVYVPGAITAGEKGGTATFPLALPVIVKNAEAIGLVKTGCATNTPPPLAESPIFWAAGIGPPCVAVKVRLVVDAVNVGLLGPLSPPPPPPQDTSSSTSAAYQSRTPSLPLATERLPFPTHASRATREARGMYT